ncbi:SDR family oxidoreductase [Azospirillum sp.]|uniref:SDR family oxidoreductase n=1 Tax=Azospirillum sp. TaxID=34012 RepID=UPI002D355E0D|nr:SDR family oxidoreductase [Azospirillum sp.]HYD67243.1 SDR family oxidoreductase [Azospirillum sp.]
MRPASIVLVIGASGFIGGRIVHRLERAGMRVVCAGRDEAALRHLFPGRAVATDWRTALAGVDAVVYAAGTIERGAGMREAHRDTPAALFAAARRTGIQRLVHLSALGAAPDADTDFLRSKGEGDAALLADRPPGWTVLRPSLVYGRGGTSAALFATLAALPLRPAVRSGPLRPIHVDDVADAVAALLAGTGPLPAVIDAVGPEEVTAEAFIARHRGWLGQPPARAAPLPPAVTQAGAAVAEAFGARLINRDAMRMLARGAAADPAGFTAATGVVPAGVVAGLAREPALDADRWAARLRPVRLPLRLSLAFLWIATGLVSLGVYPVAGSLELLAGVGLRDGPALVALYGAAGWDLLLGVALAAGVRPHLVGALQIGTILTFTAILSLFLPGFWIHPFGPLTKNVPVIAATLAMMALED